jgi:GGDEF domain-containing protein
MQQSAVVVEHVGGRWIVGKSNRMIEAFASIEQAIARARRLVARMGGDASIVVVEQPSTVRSPHGRAAPDPSRRGPHRGRPERGSD